MCEKWSCISVYLVLKTESDSTEHLNHSSHIKHFCFFLCCIEIIFQWFNLLGRGKTTKCLGGEHAFWPILSVYSDDFESKM